MFADTIVFQGITPTIILVRVSMNLSYHDEKSLVETACSLRFASHDANRDPISETGSMGQDGIGIQESNEL